MGITVTSSAFAAGERIPQRHAYTGEGDNVSPALSWSGVPDGAKELALICDDPDAPMKDPWVHWVVYRIPAAARGFAESEPPAGAVEGRNSWNENGWGGPMPPPGHGTHHYHFKVYALDTQLDLGAGATKTGLLAAMKGHVLAEGEIVGTYSR